MEKTKKVDFALGFYYLDAIFSKSEEDDKEKAEELEGRQYFSAASILQRFSPPLWFLPSFHSGFASGLLGIGQQSGQLNK